MGKKRRVRPQENCTAMHRMWPVTCAGQLPALERADDSAAWGWQEAAMGLFGKRPDAEKDLAKAIAERGAPGEATITALTATGQTRPGGAGEEFELSLRLEVAGGYL
jgi:hypothetical protein